MRWHLTAQTVILTGVSIWNLAEVQIGIIAACGPVLWPVLYPVFSPLVSLIASKMRSTSNISQDKETHELPDFVKLSDSEVQLAKGARSTSRFATDRSTMNGNESLSREEQQDIGV